MELSLIETYDYEEASYICETVQACVFLLPLSTLKSYKWKVVFETVSRLNEVNFKSRQTSRELSALFFTWF